MNEHEVDRLAAAFHVMRPDWPHASLRTFITKNLADKPRRDVAVALAWISCESNTATPARVLEAGPWWKATNAEAATSTTVHTGKTVGLRHGDPRDICGICDMWRADCETRAATSGHEFVARIECMPPTTVEGPHYKRGKCLAGPPSSPCRLTTGHDGSHDCPPSPAAEPVAHLRALRDETAGELCTHGVAPASCTDHRTTCRKRTDAETTTTEEHADA